jgi:8-amino-7-oxononanoate synthase
MKQPFIPFDSLSNSSGSRLIAGTSELHLEVESFLAKFYSCDAALIYNSGYDANLGLFSSIVQREDIVLYDELAHASIRDGIRLNSGKAYKFKHNDVADLETRLKRIERSSSSVFIAVESVYSMDGDCAPLEELVLLSKKYDAFLIVDEAHALGVFEKEGKGRTLELSLQEDVFCRVVTFGKSLGCHGAAILGPKPLVDYLINFSRSFIYTTALDENAISRIRDQHIAMASSSALQHLRDRIEYFKRGRQGYDFLDSDSAIQILMIRDVNLAKRLEKILREQGFSVKAVLSPTVAEGTERLRICLHAYNSNEEIDNLYLNFAKYV